VEYNASKNHIHVMEYNVRIYA